MDVTPLPRAAALGCCAFQVLCVALRQACQKAVPERNRRPWSPHLAEPRHQARRRWPAGAAGRQAGSQPATAMRTPSPTQPNETLINKAEKQNSPSSLLEVFVEAKLAGALGGVAQSGGHPAPEEALHALVGDDLAEALHDAGVGLGVGLHVALDHVERGHRRVGDAAGDDAAKRAGREELLQRLGSGVRWRQGVP